MNRGILILVILFLCIGCTSLTTSEGENNMLPLEQIEHWTSIYLEGVTTKKNFVSMIADGVSGVHEKNYDIRFKPRDAYFKSAELDTNKKLKFSSFILDINSEAGIKLSELKGIWGEAERGAMDPGDRYRVLVFNQLPMKISYKYEATIFAQIDGDIESEDSNIVRIHIRRDKLMSSIKE